MKTKSRRREGKVLFPSLPPRELMEAVWELRADGYSLSKAAAYLDLPTSTVTAWCRKENRAWLDPYVDHVAVNRALGGDRKVFENMTGYERLEFRDRISEGRRKEVLAAGGVFDESFLAELARMLGLEETTLLKAVTHGSRAAA